jgi:hypothetical protein
MKEIKHEMLLYEIDHCYKKHISYTKNEEIMHNLTYEWNEL